MLNLVKKRVAFFIRAYNDLDHFIPLISEFVKRDENPLIVLYTDLDFESDYRVQYLSKLGNFSMHREVDQKFLQVSNSKSIISKLKNRFYYAKRNRKTVYGKLYRKLFFDCSSQRDFLLKNEITSCVFEWSNPFSRGEIVEKYFYAAQGIGITTLSIPHGCNIFINSDVTIGYRRNTIKGKLSDESERNFFDYYILQNPIRRDGWIKWGLSPHKTQSWGSLRFDPIWASINKEICPAFNPGSLFDGKLKIVFMQFQKEYNVKNDAVLETLKKISHFKGVALAVKDATREGKEFHDKNIVSGELGEALIGWYGNDVHSPSLVDWADCVIVVGGSIGIEAILQKKHLIYPLFLNTNKTMYETFDAALCVNSDYELEEIIKNIKKGDVPNKSNGEDLLLKEIVYAGENSKFDVAKRYYENISKDYLNYANYK